MTGPSSWRIILDAFAKLRKPLLPSFLILRPDLPVAYFSMISGSIDIGLTQLCYVKKNLSEHSYNSFIMSVCSSVRVKPLDSHWMDYHNILRSSIFRKFAENIQVSFKSDKNNGHFTCRPTYIFYHISLSCS